ncbi:uncharacterized protein LOC130818637 [Amaranthus tricolor]|uniref:uncharacterized protein LOC130818637 n=1 Tax=Amaranthus tricolor TaxID=29722 RepID=UPI002582EA98|nr:uncharacterized protein LOC130818637 [Amaranthus tricolor]
MKYKGRWCIPHGEELKTKIMTEAHNSPYSIHPGGDKMYKDLKKNFWWPNMKREVAGIVAKCLTCQKMADAYFQEVVRLYGVPKDIVSDRDSRFLSKFWRMLQEAMGTMLKFSTAFHPATDGPDMIEETTKKVRMIQERMRGVQDRQKSYADKRRRALEFELGEKVLLKVSPIKGFMRFGRKGKLSPRFIGPYEVLE